MVRSMATRDHVHVECPTCGHPQSLPCRSNGALGDKYTLADVPPEVAAASEPTKCVSCRAILVLHFDGQVQIACPHCARTAVDITGSPRLRVRVIESLRVDRWNGDRWLRVDEGPVGEVQSRFAALGSEALRLVDALTGIIVGYRDEGGDEDDGGGDEVPEATPVAGLAPRQDAGECRRDGAPDELPEVAPALRRRLVDKDIDVDRLRREAAARVGRPAVGRFGDSSPLHRESALGQLIAVAEAEHALVQRLAAGPPWPDLVRLLSLEPGAHADRVRARARALRFEFNERLVEAALYRVVSPNACWPADASREVDLLELLAKRLPVSEDDEAAEEDDGGGAGVQAWTLLDRLRFERDEFVTLDRVVVARIRA